MVDNDSNDQGEKKVLTTEQWLKVSEVAEILSVHPHDVYRFINKGELRAKKISERRTRVSEEELTRFMAREDDSAS